MEDDKKQVLFQITPEHRFKNVLKALDDLDAEYDITFNGLNYKRTKCAK